MTKRGFEGPQTLFSGIALLAASFLLAGVIGCQIPEPELGEAPEATEAGPEAPPGEAGVAFEEKLSLWDEDVGETVHLDGTVVGEPIADGFFARTEGDRVLFVLSPGEVAAGERVRVEGVLGTAPADDFESWELEALGDLELEPEWEMQTTWYVDAVSVTRLEPTGTG